MPSPIRIAAAADVHVGPDDGPRFAESLARLPDDVHLILLAGDLTRLGQVNEARALAQACAERDTPVVAVLGNHDWQSDRPAEVVKALSEGGVAVLERSHTILSLRGSSVGVAGVKGFVGGFERTWANFGEPIFREAYAETTRDVEGLDRGLRAIAGCAVRIALLHYSPCEATLLGEPERLWLVLGAERLSAPIAEHRPHLVLHGHAHHGSFQGAIDGVPVHNVSAHVTGKDFWIFELDPDQQAEPVVAERTRTDGDADARA